MDGTVADVIVKQGRSAFSSRRQDYSNVGPVLDRADLDYATMAVKTGSQHVAGVNEADVTTTSCFRIVVNRIGTIASNAVETYGRKAMATVFVRLVSTSSLTAAGEITILRGPNIPNSTEQVLDTKIVIEDLLKVFHEVIGGGISLKAVLEVVVVFVHVTCRLYAGHAGYKKQEICIVSGNSYILSPYRCGLIA